MDLSAIVLREVPTGAGVPQASATQPRPGLGEDVELPVLGADYVEIEYLLSGEASTYTGPATGPATVDTEGNPYVTRLLVRHPAEMSRFSGRVVVEPFNTSVGAELDAVWGQVAPMLEASGDAWVGVTERAASVPRLKEFDPIRYADLSLELNDYAWDILRQVGGLLKQGGDQSPLKDVRARKIYMVGYSQSGVETATFVSALHELTQMTDGKPVFDGYLPAGRAASMTPLQSGASAIPSFEFSAMRPVDVPVIDIETQTDVEGFTAEIGPGIIYENAGAATVRREDSDSPDDLFRLFEVAGAPHAPKIPGCDGAGSSFPTVYFVRAALASVFAWAEDDDAAAKADRLELATSGLVSVSATDEYGNAVGGVRSPFLEAPLARYEGHSTPGVFCKLGGTESPIPADIIAQRWADVDTYMEEFTRHLDDTIEAGFLRDDDRADILAEATVKAAAAFQ